MEPPKRVELLTYACLLTNAPPSLIVDATPPAPAIPCLSRWVPPLFRSLWPLHCEPRYPCAENRPRALVSFGENGYVEKLADGTLAAS